jgi:Transposase IS116/IS110/IS902 family
MTIPGVDATAALAIVAAVGDFSRFSRPEKLRAAVADRPKLRRLELRAGLPSRRGQKGTAAAYSLKEVRRRENALTEQAEHAYRQLVADWQAKGPKSSRGVAAANGTRLSRPSKNGATAARQDSAPDPALRSWVDHAHPAA